MFIIIYEYALISSHNLFLKNSQEFVIVGGTAQEHNESRTVCEADKTNILETAKRIVPSLEVKLNFIANGS